MGEVAHLPLACLQLASHACSSPRERLGQGFLTHAYPLTLTDSMPGFEHMLRCQKDIMESKSRFTTPPTLIGQVAQAPLADARDVIGHLP